MHLSNHTVHLIHHSLFTLSKLRRPPERGRQVVKLSRQEFFPVAWELARIWRRGRHAAVRGLDGVVEGGGPGAGPGR